jgi:very-short-patch-repair endonuclease
VDGSSHELEDVNENDAAKEEGLEEFGIRVLRVSDVDVFTNIDSVLKQMEDYIEAFEGVS